MAAAAGIVPGSAADILFIHTGAPDYSVAADVENLGADPPVHLTGVDHRLVLATGFAQWTDSPAAAGAAVSPGKCIPQSVLDSWCMAGGLPTTWLRSHAQILFLSVIPSKVSEFFKAHLLVGDLDLSREYTEDTWLKALASSARACSADPRILLDDTFFFDCPPRPAAGAGSAGGSGAVYNWMYQFSGELLVPAGTTNAIAAGLLMRASAPRNSSAERDGNTQNFRRLLNALKKIASSRSDYFKSAIEDASTPADEISEYIADTWRKMVDSGYPFKFGDRVSQRNMELDNASSLAFGTAAQKELTFREMLPMKIDASSIISKCVRGSSGSEQPSEILEAFEQLADICFPGSRWSTFSMVRALELELLELTHIIDGWSGDLSVPERMSVLRKQMKSSKALHRSKGVAAHAGDGEGDWGGESASCFTSTRAVDFLVTQAEIKHLLSAPTTFTQILDVLGNSKSKTWRAVGLGKLKKSSTVIEIESCSKFTGEWRKYWTIGLATDSTGNVMKVAQGVSQSEENTEALLSGNWGSGVNWIEILEGIELKCYDIEPSSTSSLYNFATLTAVKEILNKSMALLKIAKSSDTGTYSSNGFMDRIISLERRSRALPKGSVARQNAREELVQAFKDGLDEFGDRWVNQFKRPVNYMEPMLDTFSDANCFIFNTLDTLEDTADKVFQFRHVLMKKQDFEKKAPSNHRRLDFDDSSDNDSGGLPISSTHKHYVLAGYDKF